MRMNYHAPASLLTRRAFLSRGACAATSALLLPRALAHAATAALHDCVCLGTDKAWVPGIGPWHRLASGARYG